jgi:ectoine hydroxylase-related dioxygenase (phytanoyl-CoA dioxygenase family)
MFWQRFFKKIEITFNFGRLLKYNYFNDKNINDIQKNGYVIIKNVVSNTQLQSLEDTYHQLTKFPEYSIEDKFQNSGRFRSPEIRNFVMDSIGKFSKEFLPTVFDKNIFDENTTGAFQIKPPSKSSDLNPHQDAPVIDETKENGLFVWIPLCDITENNGAVLVLPGSHLWQNHQRSLNVSWVFEKHTKLLWKYMQPIYMNRGDILVWDTALIHASYPNFSNNIRIAITTTLLPKTFKMVEYFKDKQTPKDEVEKYQVEKSFWESADIMKRPPCPPNQYLGNEKLAFQSDISKKQVLLLLEQTQEYINK